MRRIAKGKLRAVMEVNLSAFAAADLQWLITKGGMASESAAIENAIVRYKTFLEDQQNTLNRLDLRDRSMESSEFRWMMADVEDQIERGVRPKYSEETMLRVATEFIFDS